MSGIDIYIRSLFYIMSYTCAYWWWLIIIGAEHTLWRYCTYIWISVTSIEIYEGENVHFFCLLTCYYRHIYLMACVSSSTVYSLIWVFSPCYRKFQFNKQVIRNKKINKKINNNNNNSYNGDKSFSSPLILSFYARFAETCRVYDGAVDG